MYSPPITGLVLTTTVGTFGAFCKYHIGHNFLQDADIANTFLISTIVVIARTVAENSKTKF